MLRDYIVTLMSNRNCIFGYIFLRLINPAWSFTEGGLKSWHFLKETPNGASQDLIENVVFHLESL